jgi:DNA-binding transcriptional ArsR family regulator
MRRDVFQAIADPTRREIIQLIAGQSLNLNSVADNFTISRPAISKHIKILTECGLIVIRKKGRERFCEPSLRQLNEVSQWVERYRIFWTVKLDALESFLSLDARKKTSISKRVRPAKSHQPKTPATTKSQSLKKVKK